MLKRISRTWLVVIAIALVLALTVAVFGVLSAVNPARPLAATPKTTAIPKFVSPAAAVAGWQITDDQLGATGNTLDYKLYQKPKTSCTYTTGTYMDAIWYNHRGDTWISKDVLYGSAVQRGEVVRGETATNIRVAQGGSLQFATAYWRERGIKAAPRTRVVYMAARAIDTPYKLTGSVKAANPSGNGFGLDATKAVPVLIAAYQCDKGSEASASEFQALLNATTVNLP